MTFHSNEIETSFHDRFPYFLPIDWQLVSASTAKRNVLHLNALLMAVLENPSAFILTSILSVFVVEL